MLEVYFKYTHSGVFRQHCDSEAGTGERMCRAIWLINNIKRANQMMQYVITWTKTTQERLLKCTLHTWSSSFNITQTETRKRSILIETGTKFCTKTNANLWRRCMAIYAPFLYARLQTGRIMVWWCPFVRPGLRPSIRPSVTVFRTFLLHALTYWSEILCIT